MSTDDSTAPPKDSTAMDSENRLLTRPPSGVVTAGKKLLERPVVAHLLATVQRFNLRLGNQFGAAITYFLVLALIPILMFAFAALGFVLDVVRPELVDIIVEVIEEAAPGQDQLVAMLQNFLDNWQAVGLVGLASAFYTAQGFIGNLKDAVRAQLRTELGDKPKENFFLRTANNIVTLVGILVMVAITVALTVAGTGLQSTLADWLQLPGWVSGVLLISPLVTLAMSWVIFMFIFTLIPYEPIPARIRMAGSLMGAVALTILLNAATLLVDLFSGSPTAALFGPVIAIMLSMNVFARIILVVAAWMGTSEDMQQEITDTPAQEPAESSGRMLGENIAALAAGAGIVALTILGFRRFDDLGERRGRS